MGKAHNDEDIETLIQNIDVNKSGSVDYSEFVTATINRINMLSQAKLEAAFKLFDKVRLNINIFLIFKEWRWIFDC